MTITHQTQTQQEVIQHQGEITDIMIETTAEEVTTTTATVTTEIAVAVVAATETAKGKGRKKENKQQHHQQQRSSRLKQDYLNLEYKDSGKYLYLLLLY